MAKKKKSRIKKFIKIQLFITGVIFFLYLALGYRAGWGILFADVAHKGRVAGATISILVRAYGPPSQPTVIATPACTSQHSAYIKLQWGLDQDATEYDVYRDGAELMLGLTENSFDDLNVTNDTSYSYYVVAKGPKGTATSDDAEATATKCPSVTNPEVIIEILQSKNVRNLDNVPEIIQRKPLFQGQTNIPYAIVKLEVQSGVVIYATTQANANGYWQWSPPIELPYGIHKLYVTAVDPSDPDVIASTLFVFKIKKTEKEESEKSKAETTASTTSSPSASIQPKSPAAEKENQTAEVPKENQKPFEFEMEFKNQEYIKGVSINEEAYRGENLEVKVSFTDVVQENQTISLKYTLASLDQETLVEYNDNIKINSGREITRKIPLSYNLALGKYKLQVSATIGNTTVSHESYFILKDRPILKLGMTYIAYTDLVSNLGWLISVSLLILLFFGAAALWEHHLARRALFQITGKVLKKKGFIN